MAMVGWIRYQPNSELTADVGYLGGQTQIGGHLALFHIHQMNERDELSQ